MSRPRAQSAASTANISRSSSSSARLRRFSPMGEAAALAEYNRRAHERALAAASRKRLQSFDAKTAAQQRAQQEHYSVHSSSLSTSRSFHHNSDDFDRSTSSSPPPVPAPPPPLPTAPAAAAAPPPLVLTDRKRSVLRRLNSAGMTRRSASQSLEIPKEQQLQRRHVTVMSPPRNTAKPGVAAVPATTSSGIAMVGVSFRVRSDDDEHHVDHSDNGKKKPLTALAPRNLNVVPRKQQEEQSMFAKPATKKRSSTPRQWHDETDSDHDDIHQPLGGDDASRPPTPHPKAPPGEVPVIKLSLRASEPQRDAILKKRQQGRMVM